MLQFPGFRFAASGLRWLHISGGRVTIDEMERAFNWNHEQHNTFTHMPTDAKVPWGAALEELVKRVTEQVKTGAAAYTLIFIEQLMELLAI